MAVAHQALTLAAAAPREAVALLRQAAAGGDPEAMLMLGLWHIEGRHLSRNFAAARGYLHDAAERGHVGATRLLAGFLAAGRGGQRNWTGACALLTRIAAQDPAARHQLDLIAAMNLADEGAARHVPASERLTDTPRIERVPGLLSPAECRFLIEATAARFRRATIFHEGERRFVEDPLRTSGAAAIGIIFEGPAIHALNRRFAAVSGTDVRQGETLQLLRYRHGERYHPHLDALPGLANQRVLTLLVYLNDDYTGGETLFPAADLAFRGRTGDGLLFRNALDDGRPDPASRHAGAPVIADEKLIASRWIRARPPESDEAGFGRHEMT